MMGIAGDGLIKSLRVDRLHVLIYATREQMGKAAAAAVADELRRLIAEDGRAVGIFASAPSQNEFLAALVRVVKPAHRAAAERLVASLRDADAGRSAA